MTRISVAFRPAFFLTIAVGLFCFMTGFAAAHVVTVPPPTGPYNIYYAENGMFGVFCARAYVDVFEVGSYQGSAQTGARYSPNGVCSDWLPQDFGNLYASVVLRRPGGAVCGSASAYNAQGAYLTLVSTGYTGCFGGQAYSYGYHQSVLYSTQAFSWWTPNHPGI